MSEEGGIPEVDQDTIDNEVDTLFVKTQVNPEEKESYDTYIPLSVQMERNEWNILVPSKQNDASTEIATNNDEPVSFPLNRVRKIMKMDPSVKIISKQAVALMARATTLFIDSMAVKTAHLMENRGSKQVRGSSIVQICKDSPELKFLLDDLLLEEMDSKRVKVAPSKPEKVKEVPIAKNAILSFFNKNK